jgi:hypothetical protein
LLEGAESDVEGAGADVDERISKGMAQEGVSNTDSSIASS